MKIGIDFQTLVPSWYFDRSNFCFEARYKSNQDFGAPAVPPTLILWTEPPGLMWKSRTENPRNLGFPTEASFRPGPFQWVLAYRHTCLV